MTIQLPQLILASGSPRRVEILNSVGWKFKKHSAHIDESLIDGESPEDYVVRLAREKAETVATKFPDSIVLGADTTVVIDDEILGKPVDMDEALRMLRLLSGNWHEVLTGVAVVKNGTTRSAMQRTRVKFISMTDDEVEFLATKGDPLDKAGAYAVQAQAALFIEKVEGEYWNIVGLPINLVYKLVMQKGETATVSP
jgi:septum formation protein